MAKRGDENSDLSWLYDDDQTPAMPGKRRLSISDLYEDDEVTSLLPPLEDVEESSASQSETLLDRLTAALPIGRAKSREFAGADLSGPSHAERERSEPSKRRIRETPLIGEDDPFARLVTPLSNAEVANLRAELAGEEIFLGKWKRRHEMHARWKSFGLLLSLAVLCLLSLRYGKSYVDTAMNHPKVPTWLALHLGTDPAKAVMFALAVMLPFLGIVVMVDFFTHTLKFFLMRSLAAFGIVIISGMTLFLGGIFIAEKKTLLALATLGVWVGCRGLIRLVLGRGENS